MGQVTRLRLTMQGQWHQVTIVRRAVASGEHRQAVWQVCIFKALHPPVPHTILDSFCAVRASSEMLATALEALVCLRRFLRRIMAASGLLGETYLAAPQTVRLLLLAVFAMSLACCMNACRAGSKPTMLDWCSAGACSATEDFAQVKQPEADQGIKT